MDSKAVTSSCRMSTRAHCLLACFFEAAAAAEIALGGDNEVAVPGEFDGGQQTEAAVRSCNNCDFLVRHGSPTNPANRQRGAKWSHSRSEVCDARLEYEKIIGLNILHETE